MRTPLVSIVDVWGSSERSSRCLVMHLHRELPSLVSV